MIKQVLFYSLCFWMIMSCTQNDGAGNIQLKDLQTEMRENPEGIGVANPRFSWKMVSN